MYASTYHKHAVLCNPSTHYYYYAIQARYRLRLIRTNE